MKTCEQAFYNMGFTGVENSSSVVVFQAWRFRFLEGWLAAVNAIDLPKSSMFRDLDQIPLPNDPPVQALTQEQPNKEERKSGKGVGKHEGVKNKIEREGIGIREK